MDSEIEALIEDLQIKFAFQEETIKQLNAVIYDQQHQIDRLEAQIKQVKQRLADAEHFDSVDPKDEGPPPHY